MMDVRKPRLIILAGPNGSGKSTFAAQLNAPRGVLTADF